MESLTLTISGECSRELILMYVRNFMDCSKGCDLDKQNESQFENKNYCMNLRWD
jgi:hypothetical protein